MVTGPSIGPSLRPFRTEPIAYKLVTASDTETMVGSALHLRVSTFESRDNIKTCIWSSPEGVTYLVDKNTVRVNGKLTHCSREHHSFINTMRSVNMKLTF